MVCTFFGHRYTPDRVEPLLRDAVERLICEHGVDTFYVGSEGNFDRMAARVLHQMQQIYPISFAVVLSRMPAAGRGPEREDYPTILPEGVEVEPPRFAIDRRNRWMVEQADYVVTCVLYSAGGAAKFKALAERRGKVVWNLSLPGTRGE